MSLQLDTLQITCDGRTLVSLDVTVEAGEILTLMGPSGCGKSTALLALVGALPHGFAMRGRVLLDGCDVTTLPSHRRRVGLLFQDDILFPHLSVAGNLGFGLPRHITDREARIAKALTDVGLDGIGPRDPATLSGGQRARVALMRTMLSAPRALLLDEPFSKLDADLRAQTRDLTFRLARHLPTILVTHDREDALAAGGRILSVRGDPLS